MLPLHDKNPTLRFPVVTVALIVANTAIFAYEFILSPPALERLFQAWAVIPVNLVADPGPRTVATVFTAMFLHGGVIHLGGNMLYLWIFGNNIEDRMGQASFLTFYLLCGIGATVAQVAVDRNSAIPNIGASGAIAGVMGGYILLFPRARVVSLLFFGYFVRLIEVSAVWVLGYWIVIQLFSGALSLGMASTGGVAWFAHIGGFVAGLVLVNLFARRRAPS
ncbi:MAG: rhomboid family intramembrane serine protease [Anaerolineae bacterium]